MRRSPSQLLLLTIVLGLLTPGLACAAEESSTKAIHNVNVLNCGTHRKQDLQKLLELWRQKCREWKHCAGAQCRYDIASGLEKPSFQNFVMDMREQVGPLLAVPTTGNFLSEKTTSPEDKIKWVLDEKQLEDAFESAFPDLSSIISNQSLQDAGPFRMRQANRLEFLNADSSPSPQGFFSYGFPTYKSNPGFSQLSRRGWYTPGDHDPLFRDALHGRDYYRRSGDTMRMDDYTRMYQWLDF